MEEIRKNMDEALKEITIPFLREEGFKGSFPHFRRKTKNQLDLLSFQFRSSGGSFVVEIVSCPPEDFTTSWGEVIPMNKLNVQYFNNRLRLGSTPKTDYWFDFKRKIILGNIYKKTAKEVVELFKSQGESFYTHALANTSSNSE